MCSARSEWVEHLAEAVAAIRRARVIKAEWTGGPIIYHSIPMTPTTRILYERRQDEELTITQRAVPWCVTHNAQMAGVPSSATSVGR